MIPAECRLLQARGYAGSNNECRVRAFERSEMLRDGIAHRSVLLERRGIAQERVAHHLRTLTARRVTTILFGSSVVETEKQGAKVERLKSYCAGTAYRYEHRNLGG